MKSTRGGKREGAGRHKKTAITYEHRWMIPEDIHLLAKEKGTAYLWEAVRFKVAFDKLKNQNKMEAKKDRIIAGCLYCIDQWITENWQQRLDIDDEDYANYCYEYGGEELRNRIDEYLTGMSEDEEQEFFAEINKVCKEHNQDR